MAQNEPLKKIPST